MNCERSKYRAGIAYILDAAETAIAKATVHDRLQATDRPGHQAAAMHEETGIDYETGLIMCNMD